MEVELIQRLARGRGASPVQLRGGEKKKLFYLKTVPHANKNTHMTLGSATNVSHRSRNAAWCVIMGC